MPLEPPAAIAILGGGPAAIEAALYGRFLGYRVQLIAGGALFAAIESRANEPLTATWDAMTTPLGQAALEAQRPDQPTPNLNRRLTLRDWIDGYLRPLAESDLLADSIHAEQQIVAIEAKEVEEAEEEDEEFEPLPAMYLLTLRDAAGSETSCEVNSLIDADGGLPTPGLAALPHYFVLQASSESVAATAERIQTLYAELFGRPDLDLYERMRRAGGGGR